jgi:hypothetical protein
MSTPQLRLSNPIGGAHPAVRERRMRELMLIAATALIPLVIALGIAVEVPNPSPALVVGITLGVPSILALVISTRYEITLGLLVVYLGLLDGPIKLLSASQAASALRNVLISAIGLGMILRLIVRRERVSLPPLAGWVLVFVAFVLVEAVNPKTNGILKIVGGVRQQLEWVPFFFFAYLVMRSKERFRKLFIILGVIALANGVVSTIQTRLTPAQNASWGPGYGERVEGASGLGGRTYVSEGEGHVRPLALGSDIGFGGAVGVIALPGVLALLAIGRFRRRWVLPLLCLGALLAVATSLQRTEVIGAVVAALSFLLLSFSAGRGGVRALAALSVVVVLALVMAAVLASSEGKGVFSRYESIATPGQAATTSVSYRERTLSQIPADIANAPFGFGLSTVGAAAGFGGRAQTKIEGAAASGESQYNYLTLEVGLPGLLLWIAFLVKLLVLVVRRIGRIEDTELRTYLIAVVATLFAFTVMGFAGPTTASAAGGPFFWSAAGIAAYWLAGSMRSALPAIRAREA